MSNELLAGWVEGERDRPRYVGDAIASHRVISGPSGFGKSQLAAGLIMSLVRESPAPRVVVFDMKGELASDLVHRWLPAMAPVLPEDFLNKIVVIESFAPDFGVPMDPLVPQPDAFGTYAEQALLFSRAMSHLVEGMGERMRGLAVWLARAALDASWSLTGITRALSSDPDLARLQRDVTDVEVVHYLAETFPREPAASKRALGARLEELLTLPKLRAVLSSGKSVSAASLIEAPLTIINPATNAPVGSSSVVRFLGALFLRQVVAGIFTRRVDEHTPWVHAFFDEWAALASDPSVIGDVESLVARSRFCRTSTTWLHQAAGQVPSGLRATMTSSVGAWWAFRPEPEDIRHLRAMLPLTRSVRNPERPDELLPPDAERRVVEQRLCRLPKRWALYCDRNNDFSAVVETPTLPIERADELAAAASPALVSRTRRGRFGVEWSTLLAAADVPTKDSDARRRSHEGERPHSAGGGGRRRPRLVLP